MESSNKQRLTLADLPYRIEKSPLARKFESRQSISTALSYIGIAVAIIGGLILIGGPSSIQVGWDGPSLWELILLSPGPIISIGMMLLFIGSQILPPVIQELDAFIEENFALVDDNGIPVMDAVITWQSEAGGNLSVVAVSLNQPAESEQSA
ncbi:hypothetical protein [Marinobacter nauticus]|uniref:hypothetical protein n=1 Tax=Marinobacter nauticus TaxID=2743 RepID=UPI001CFEE571|nr:hypothetical protein [Marinobacter nauticus]